MAMTLGPSGDGDEDELTSSINTTPLVDVMLVLLIIFLITIPVVTHTVPVVLPKETNHPSQTKPQNVIIAVNHDGDMFWNEVLVPNQTALFDRLKKIAVMVPQPEVHIRGDVSARYEAVGKVMFTLQRAGIQKIAFITQPPPHHL